VSCPADPDSVCTVTDDVVGWLEAPMSVYVRMPGVGIELPSAGKTATPIIRAVVIPIRSSARALISNRPSVATLDQCSLYQTRKFPGDGTLGDRFVVRSLVARAFLCVLASGCTRTDVTAGPTTPTPTPTPTRIPRTFATKHFSISLTDVNQWVPMASGDRAGAVWGE
jgi:hypothetical protein